MKLSFRIYFILLAALYISFFDAKCNHDVECTADSCFSIDTFLTYIKKTLDTGCMGYGVTIDYKGHRERIYSNGKRRTQPDGGVLPYDIFAKFHIASMSKTITTIATLQLLKKNNISTYALIKDYLPPDWTIGPNINKITFRMLLKHEAGIRVTSDTANNGDDYRHLKNKIAEGVITDSMGVPQYQNMNFSLLRVLISKLDGHASLAANNDTATANNYIRYVRKNICEPSSCMGEIGCLPDTNLHYYVWPYDNSFGQTFADYSTVCGAFGWYMSPNDYGNIISKLFYSEDLLNAKWRDTMTVNLLGCYPDNVIRGTSYNHNGGWGITWIWNGKTTKGSANSGWISFPNGITCVCMSNSDIPGTWYPGVMLDAYKNAWKHN